MKVNKNVSVESPINRTIQHKAVLVLADGQVFHGQAIGSRGEAVGEVVFNTSMSGYQEILTDPSYAYQMITFTYPHIGNVGVNAQDNESSRVWASGLIVKELCEHYSNFRAESSLGEFLRQQNVVGISGIDTRSLVLHLREHGAQMGIIASEPFCIEDLMSRVKRLDPMEGRDLVKEVTTQSPYSWAEGTCCSGQGELGLGDKCSYKTYSEKELAGRPLVVAIDCGIKRNILRLLVEHGFRVIVVPATSSSEEILSNNPDAIFLSNGPGDPAALGYLIETVKQLVGKKPIFGICLGHQILGWALGAPTKKLKFGHRGANHPVRDETTRKVAITSQNHGFATDWDRLPASLRVSQVNINDHTISGFDFPEISAFSVQYHPEASPGPCDTHFLFERFRQMVGASACCAGRVI